MNLNFNCLSVCFKSMLTKDPDLLALVEKKGGKGKLLQSSSKKGWTFVLYF